MTLSPTMRPWRWAWHRLLVMLGLRKHPPFSLYSDIILRIALENLENNLVIRRYRSGRTDG